MSDEKKVRCFLSEAHDPWFNLATEDWIFRDMNPDQHVLFLWRNSDTVVIGRTQNPWAECDLQKMKRDGVALARRQSGGGAVFQDLGNTNFTFLSSKDKYDRRRNFSIIINALNKLGVDAQVSGRNDITVQGKKISGSAFKEKPDRAFHHGTLLVNVNMSKLGQYLTPSKKKLMSKGAKSVKARVANLQEFNPTISHEILKEAIIDEFFTAYGAERHVEALDNKVLKSIPEVQEYYNHLKSDAWRFGESPRFDHFLEERFDWGTMQVHLNAEKGVISDVKIFSDALHPEMIESLMTHIKGAAYKKDVISNRIDVVQEKLPHLKGHLQEFSEWMVREIG